jgi:hypothetical protein
MLNKYAGLNGEPYRSTYNSPYTNINHFTQRNISLDKKSVIATPVLKRIGYLFLVQ